MPSFTFYGGASEIGGNKILLEDKNTEIFLNFGEGFNLGAGYAYDYLKLQATFGLVPQIPRIFSQDALRIADLKYKKLHNNVILPVKGRKINL